MSIRTAVVCLAALLLVSSVVSAQRTPFDVGVKVGDKIPAFNLTDQNGTMRDFASLKGPKGVVLLFFRSADW